MTPALTLVIGDMTLSCRSLHPWFAPGTADIAFEEILLPTGLPEGKAQIRALSNAGQMLRLFDASAGGRPGIWKCLATRDRGARLTPAAGLRPKSAETRSRCIGHFTRMNAGFGARRRAMPRYPREALPGQRRDPGALDPVERIEASGREVGARFCAEGLVFGRFRIAEGGPVTVRNRFATSGVGPDPVVGKPGSDPAHEPQARGDGRSAGGIADRGRARDRSSIPFVKTERAACGVSSWDSSPPSD